MCHNAVDRHLATLGSQPALIYVSTEVEQEQVYTFTQLHAEVQRMAACLLALGVQQGDRVLIYMPMVPEAVFAMLACVRIGAIHSVVFGGFASVSLASRIDDARPAVIVSADAGSRNGKVMPYKPLLDEAIRLAQHKPARVLMVDRGLNPFARVEGRDVDFAALRERHTEHRRAVRMGRRHTSQLHAVHQRDHRQTEGCAARYRWVCGRIGGVDEAHLPGRARRDLLLDQRHRLGGWPQLHRVRAAAGGHGDLYSTRACRSGPTRESGGSWSSSTR
mgnify:CR=1 FL=1